MLKSKNFGQNINLVFIALCVAFASTSAWAFDPEKAARCTPVTLRAQNYMNYNGASLPGWTPKTIYYDSASLGDFYSDDFCENMLQYSEIDAYTSEAASQGINFYWWQASNATAYANYSDLIIDEYSGGWAGTTGSDAEDALIDSGNVLEPYWECMGGYTMYNNDGKCWKNYNLTSNYNGGSCTPPNPTSYTEQTATFSLCQPTKTGYVFAGWCDDSALTQNCSQYKAVPKGTTSNKTYYAKWTPITYTVTYNKNAPSGTTVSGTTADSSHTYGVSKALTSNGYALTGYTFSGWNTKANGSGTSYSNGQSVSNLTTTNGATVTLYAKWAGNVSGQITISYPGDGANATNKTTALWTRYNTGVYTSQANANSNSSAITSITPPALACYDFTGVYSGSTVMINQSGAIQNGLKTLVSSSGGTASIEARFQEWPYAILKDGSTNKGILHYDNNKVYATSACNTPLVAGGQAITVESRTGYTFGGYKCTGYTGNDSQCATYDNNGVLVINESGKVTQEGISSMVDCLSSIDPLTCNAVWNANQYTITFNANGGSGGQSGSKTVTYGESLPSISTTAPTRSGYTFGGWYDAQTGGNRIYNADGTPFLTGWNQANNAILYARWTPGVITITWYGVGNGTDTGGIGTGFAPTQTQNVYTSTVNYGDDIRTPGVVTGGTVSTGRKFLGWRFAK